MLPDALTAAIHAVRAQGRRVKFLYTIPNFNNPSGVLTSLERRHEIARICRERPRDVAVLAGDDAWTLPILALGGGGWLPRLLRHELAGVFLRDQRGAGADAGGGASAPRAVVRQVRMRIRARVGATCGTR